MLKSNIPRNQFDPELLSLPWGNKAMPLQDVLEHAKLYRAYPQLRDYPVSDVPGFNFMTSGAFNPETRQIMLSGGRSADVHSTLMHEIQHAIQSIEGFPKGGNLSEFLPNDIGTMRASVRAMEAELNKNVSGFNPFTSRFAYDAMAAGKSLAPYQQEALQAIQKAGRMDLFERWVNAYRQLSKVEDDAFKTYQRLAGEAEARAVQARLKDPTKTIQQSYDVPWSELIFK